MGQITATRNLVATKVVRLAGQLIDFVSLGILCKKPQRHSVIMLAPYLPTMFTIGTLTKIVCNGKI